MDKAYDLKALGQKIAEKAKEDGLHLAEEAAEKLAKAAYFGVKEWAKGSAGLSANPIDDFAAKFYDQLDRFIIPQIEKLDLDHDGA